MDQKKEKIDMLHGPLIKNLLLFTLPIALGSMLQQLFNAAATSIIGYFGDADALAAVGTNGVTGVAIATDLSTFLSAFLVFYRLKRDRGVFQVSFRKLRIHREYLAAILKLGSHTENTLYCLSDFLGDHDLNGRRLF